MILNCPAYARGTHKSIVVVNKSVFVRRKSLQKFSLSQMKGLPHRYAFQLWANIKNYWLPSIIFSYVLKLCDLYILSPKAPKNLERIIQSLI